jgi:DNA-binding response OmpR family regulator
MRVLLIEDDAMLASGLRRALADAGMDSSWAGDGRSGLELLEESEYDIALLDLGLPDLDGRSLLDTIRRRDPSTPVLIISADDDPNTRAECLLLGAADFFDKPFEVPKILARVSALAHRPSTDAVARIGTAQIELDLVSHKLAYRGRSDILTSREFALMRAFIESPGAILSRSQIKDRICQNGREMEAAAIDMLISRVRGRFGREIIRNVRGAGWMIARA